MRNAIPKEFTERVAARLHRLRTKANLSQEDVAADLDLSRGAVANHESGKKAHQLGYVARYASYYGVTLDEIVKDL